MIEYSKDHQHKRGGLAIFLKMFFYYLQYSSKSHYEKIL